MINVRCKQFGKVIYFNDLLEQMYAVHCLLLNRTSTFLTDNYKVLKPRCFWKILIKMFSKKFTF